MEKKMTLSSKFKAKAKAFITKAKNYYTHKKFMHQLKPYVPPKHVISKPNAEREEHELNSLKAQRRVPLAAGRRYGTGGRNPRTGERNLQIHPMIPKTGPRSQTLPFLFPMEDMKRNKMDEELKDQVILQKGRLKTYVKPIPHISKENPLYNQEMSQTLTYKKRAPKKKGLEATYKSYWEGLNPEQKKREKTRTELKGGSYGPLELPSGKKYNHPLIVTSYGSLLTSGRGNPILPGDYNPGEGVSANTRAATTYWPNV
jgi:hypothetical protein